MDKPEWMWDEWQQVGTDYDSLEEVGRYEKRMGEFRDFDRENSAVLALTGLKAGENVRILEIGTGTGHFARFAARAGFGVTAVDISAMMLKYAAEMADKESIPAGMIEFVRGGFLGLDFAAASFDACYTSAALHHLPDVWKMVALESINRVLKPGGIFILRDVVFSWENGDYAACFDGFVNLLPEATRTPAARHAAKEYSTLDWIMKALLERAGFEVTEERDEGHCLRLYRCRKF